MAKIGWTVGTRVWLRDSGRCVYCGCETDLESPGPCEATLDHFIPQSRNGPSHISNLVLSCRSCNGGKENGKVLSGRLAEVRHYLRRLYPNDVPVRSRPRSNGQSSKQRPSFRTTFTLSEAFDAALRCKVRDEALSQRVEWGLSEWE